MRKGYKIKLVMFFLAVMIFGSSLNMQFISAKTLSNYNIYVSNESFGQESDYSSSIKFKGKNVIIKGKISLQNKNGEALKVKKQCKIKIASNCKFYYGEGKISFKEIKQHVKEAGNNCYVGFGVTVKKGKAVSMGLYA